MSGTDNKKGIVLFEDDSAFAGIVTMIGKKLGYQVQHYEAFPSVSADAYLQLHPESPLLVVLDYGLPGMNGLEVCRLLRRAHAEDDFPIVFLSGNSDEETIVACYEAGADDFIVKPIQMPQLEAKLDKILRESENRLQIKKQLADSRDIALMAMSTTSELGEIIRFLERLFECVEPEQVAKSIFTSLADTGLLTCLKMYVKPENRYFASDGIEREIEQKLLDEFRAKGRIFDFGKRTIFNFNKVSLLVKNMPLEDQDRYGKLKDNLCIMLNGVDARLSALETHYVSKKQNASITATASVLKMMIAEIEQSNIELSKEFEDIIQDMEFGISNAMMHFNLLEEEENKIMSLVTQAMTRASEVFDRSIEKGKHYRKVMNGLMDTLEKGNQ